MSAGWVGRNKGKVRAMAADFEGNPAVASEICLSVFVQS